MSLCPANQEKGCLRVHKWEISRNNFSKELNPVFKLPGSKWEFLEVARGCYILSHSKLETHFIFVEAITLDRSPG